MLEIFQYEFMIRSFIAAVIISIICPCIGVFLVLRRLSFMADTLAHISMAGVAIGVFFGISPVISTLVCSISAALGIEKLRKDSKVFSETILALIMSGGMALAIVMISFSKGIYMDLFSYLFGSILTISNMDLILIAGLGLVVGIILLFIWQDLFIISFDEDTVKILGYQVNLINMIYALLVAITISIAMKLVGVLLVSSLMVIPVMTGMQICSGFKNLIKLSAFFGFMGTIIGIYLSFYFNLATGGSIVLTLILMFFTVFLFSKLRHVYLKSQILAKKNESLTLSDD